MFFCSGFGMLVIRGQRMPVGHEEEALVVSLQLYPVLERAMVIAQVQLARGSHAGQHAGSSGGTAKWRAGLIAGIIRSRCGPCPVAAPRAAIDREIHHRGGLDAAMPAIDNRIELVFQPLPDLPRHRSAAASSPGSSSVELISGSPSSSSSMSRHRDGPARGCRWCAAWGAAAVAAPPAWPATGR